MLENRVGSTIRYDTIRFIVPVGKFVSNSKCYAHFFALEKKQGRDMNVITRKKERITGRQTKRVDLKCLNKKYTIIESLVCPLQ